MGDTDYRKHFLDHRLGPKPAGRLMISWCLLLVMVAALACQAEAPRKTTAEFVITPAGAVTHQGPQYSPDQVYSISPRIFTWAEFDLAVQNYVDGHFEETAFILAGLKTADLTEDQKRSANFLSGLVAFKLGQAEAVDRYFSETAKVPKSLVAYTWYYRGQAHFNAGRYQEARHLLAEFLRLDPDSHLAGPARLTRAEALGLLRQWPEAFREIKALLNTDQAAEAKLLLARVYETQGDKVQARDHYRQAMQASNFQPVRAKAAEKYFELLRAAASRPGQEDLKLEMIRFLRQEWLLDQALSWIDRLVAQGGSPGFLAALQGEKATILWYAGRITEAQSCYPKPTSPEQIRTNLYGSWMYARCLERLGLWAQTAETFRMIAAAAPAKRDEALFEAGLAHLRLKQKDQALEAWSKLSPAAINGPYKDARPWRLGLYSFHHKDWPAAVDNFRSILKDHPGSKFTAAATYWLGRSLEESGKKTEAAEQYRQLLVPSADQYYRMMADHRLNRNKKKDHWADLPAFQAGLALEQNHADRSFLPLRYHQAASTGRNIWALSDPGYGLGDLWTERRKIINLPSPTGVSLKGTNALSRLKDLAAAGALDLAHQEAEILRGLIKAGAWGDHKNLPDLTARLLAFSSAYLAQVGDYYGFVRLQYVAPKPPYLTTVPEALIKNLRRYYPLAYPGPVLQAARDYHLHPALILAIMRTESFYQPGIMSVSNARGLMQLLPSTGNKIAACLGRSDPHPEALFAPENNIRFGAWYLAAMIKDFDGQYPLAIASYNGGPFNVRRWVQQAGDLTMEEFIETIPFDQTRLYVKKVMAEMYQYRLLYTGVAASPDLTARLRNPVRNDITF